MILLALGVSALAGLMLTFMMLSPTKQSYDDAIQKAKGAYESNQGVDTMYLQQLKSNWFSDANEKTRYYSIFCITLLFYPLLYYILYASFLSYKPYTVLPLSTLCIAFEVVLVLTSILYFAFQGFSISCLVFVILGALISVATYLRDYSRM